MNKGKDVEKVKKKSIKEKVSDKLGLPKEIMLDLPQMILKGNKELFIENYKGIIEYTEEVMRINANENIIKVCGKNLGIKSIADTEITLLGDIKSVEFN